MLRLTKHEKEKLKKLAKLLPQTYYEANVKLKMSGSEILKSDTIDHGKFSEIKPEKYYLVDRKTNFPVNHSNRIIKAYTEGGMQAVNEYCNKVQELVQKSHNPIKGLTN